MMTPIERTKYMDEDESKRLRTVTEAWAITVTLPRFMYQGE